MAKGSSGSDGKGKKERIRNWRSTRASRRNPQYNTMESAGTPF